MCDLDLAQLGYGTLHALSDEDLLAIYNKMAHEHTAYLEQGVEFGVLEVKQSSWVGGDGNTYHGQKLMLPIGKKGKAYLDANEARYTVLVDMQHEIKMRRWLDTRRILADGVRAAREAMSAEFSTMDAKEDDGKPTQPIP